VRVEARAYWEGAEDMGAVVRERIAALGATPKVLRDVDDLLERARSHTQGELKEALGLPS